MKQSQARSRQLMRWMVVALVLAVCVPGVVGWVSAAAPDGSGDALHTTVVRYLDARYRALVTLDSSTGGASVSPTDQTAIAEAWNDVDVAIARELGCGWGEYSLKTEVVDVRVAGTTADVTIRADVDFHYASSPEVDSGVYNVIHRFRLVRTGDDWRIVSIDSDDEDFLRFKHEVMGKTGKGRSVREAADIARRERISDLRRLADQLRAVEIRQPTTLDEVGGFSALSIEPLAAASYSYSGSNGSSYAQRFAPASAPRWFYYVNGGNCTNFVSQCVWAAYGGYVSSSDTTSKNNITNKVRMVPNVWHGGTGGGMPNWESVTSFWTYATNSTKTRGPMATGYNNGAKYTGINPADVRVGNVLQVRNGSSGNYGHSVYVSVVRTDLQGPIWWDYIYVCQHTSDWKNRLASNLIASWGGSNCNMRRLVFRAGTFDK
ncbi:MAG: amidase domain-containing protein [Candidatus Eisenbacteria bacterium]|nr:amidase domain-containing protein [Candidatus Eisenbacteria bacterium]